MKWTAGSHASGSGSGKSTFTNRIKAYFGDDVAVLYHDNYYRCQDGVPFEQRVTVNYDHPDSLETDLLIEHLKEILASLELRMQIIKEELLQVKAQYSDALSLCRTDPFQGICGHQQW